MVKGKTISNSRYIPYNADITDNARQLRKIMTESERKLWFCYLKDCGIRFSKQKQIESYIVDFYCVRAKVVIEVDGDSHFNENALKYDKERTKVLERYGLRIIRFTNTDIKYRFQEVCSTIEEIIKPYK